MKLKQNLALASVIALAACGTIFNGGSQDMKFDSNVKGVTLYIDGAKVCNTPCVYPVERRASSFVVMAKKKGYEDQYQTIRSSWSKISFLNLTFVYSWTTDLATGGMWKYDRDGVYIEWIRKDVIQPKLNRINKIGPSDTLLYLAMANLKMKRQATNKESTPKR